MRGSEAARSVANFLLFDDNPLMQRNKHIYNKQYKKEELFLPDQVVRPPQRCPEYCPKRMLDIHKQRTLEERYLKFIEEKFKYVDNEFPPEMQDDRKKFDTYVSAEDKFDYAAVQKLLSPAECKALRSIFPDIQGEQILEELEGRVKLLWPTAKFEERSCSRKSRSAACPRPVVLSIENDDCSEWLGAMHTGCAVVFCT
ncbi:unnamed protein product [Strongylus vulgaris]|uniref:Uncharacterized protein n=1 Tax=Strongylus vulgaris TaxID=40348 RepID=A0A3P7KWU4_STRVU|nr:unnamed protein product [Strongylus vulgaris]